MGDLLVPSATCGRAARYPGVGNPRELRPSCASSSGRLAADQRKRLGDRRSTQRSTGYGARSLTFDKAYSEAISRRVLWSCPASRFATLRESCATWTCRSGTTSESHSQLTQTLDRQPGDTSAKASRTSRATQRTGGLQWRRDGTPTGRAGEPPRRRSGFGRLGRLKRRRLPNGGRPGCRQGVRSPGTERRAGPGRR